MQQRIVQLVPTAQGGVRDYADGLELEWSRRGVGSLLLPFDHETARRQSLVERLATSAAAGDHPCLLLHLSVYGYARRGLCFWLLRELQQARRELGTSWPLVTVVHELFTSGPPWRPAHWLGRFQAHLVSGIVGLSDSVVTNSDHHGAWLSARVSSGVPVRVAPVFSNVGEPADVRAAGERSAGLVVFGSASTRQRAFGLLGSHLAELAELHIEHVVEVGPGPATSFAAPGLTCAHVGEQAPAEVERLLQSHRYGLIDYPSFHLGKSGVFAAYAAHGCVVLNTAADRVDADGLRSGRHYLSLRPGAAAALGASAAAAMSTRLHHWYLGHRRGRQATELLAELLR